MWFSRKQGKLITVYINKKVHNHVAIEVPLTEYLVVFIHILQLTWRKTNLVPTSRFAVMWNIYKRKCEYQYIPVIPQGINLTDYDKHQRG